MTRLPQVSSQTPTANDNNRTRRTGTTATATAATTTTTTTKMNMNMTTSSRLEQHANKTSNIGGTSNCIDTTPQRSGNSSRTTTAVEGADVVAVAVTGSNSNKVGNVSSSMSAARRKELQLQRQRRRQKQEKHQQQQQDDSIEPLPLPPLLKRSTASTRDTDHSMILNNELQKKERTRTNRPKKEEKEEQPAADVVDVSKFSSASPSTSKSQFDNVFQQMLQVDLCSNNCHSNDDDKKNIIAKIDTNNATNRGGHGIETFPIHSASLLQQQKLSEQPTSPSSSSSFGHQQQPSKSQERSPHDDIERQLSTSPTHSQNTDFGGANCFHDNQYCFNETRHHTSNDYSRHQYTNNTNNEIGSCISIGYIWRYIVRCILLQTLDHVNMLRISRILQLHLPFVSFHEAFLINQLLECIQIEYNNKINDNHNTMAAMKSGSNVTNTTTVRKHHRYNVLQFAFENRNVSRLIVQILRVRYDYVYHVPTAVQYNRYFDMIGQFPIIGSITRFPATENFPATRNHALASIFRIVLGPGNWITRVITGGRQGLIVDDPNHIVAQNLTAESNGLELANRNQYGTYYGRHKYTNQFRIDHRLPTDESLIRTFITVPIPTMTNNGVVHTLRTLAKHWYNIVHVQKFGNFAHQRMELLDPFETIRIYIPTVLVTLSSLRGRNKWDSTVLAPFLKKCTNLDVEIYAINNLDDSNDNTKCSRGIQTALSLVQELRRTMLVPVSGGISTVTEPFLRWVNSIEDSFYLIRKEADEVHKLVSSVELGIRYGYDIITQTNWKVPSDVVLINAIRDYIAGSCYNDNHNKQIDSYGKSTATATTVSYHLISKTLERTTPRDKRTLIDLIHNNLSYTRPAQLLIKRMKTLLQREIRRDLLNSSITQLSKGEYVTDNTMLQNNDWYWLENKKQQSELHIFCGTQRENEKVNNDQMKNSRIRYLFRNITSGSIKNVSVKSDGTLRHYKVRRYVAIAEAISQAQKVLMIIELDHLKKFSYNAFMEFHHLRVPLQRLLVVGQMTCEVLDNARLQLLREVQQWGRTNQKNGTLKIEPQNIIVVGGGPGGMMACLHCTENCLRSGGEMKLFEARDTFAKGGSTYERAQIVRLDARWIATMRYHLGSGFEDVFIPASGETDAQLGNRLALQGFVEITIKDLENILHVEVSRLWSKGLISVFTDSRSKFDPASNALTKYGENLKVGDTVLLQLDPNGLPCHEYQSWTVVELVYTKVLDVNEIKVNEEYGVYYRPDEVVLPFIFKSVDLTTKMYHFVSKNDGVADIHVHVNDLPSIYPSGTGMHSHADIHRVVCECTKPNHHNKNHRMELHMSCIKRDKFTIDVGNTHVIEAIGKPHKSQVHFPVTTEEPHGVCCLEGLKVSLGMHNFGEKRWGSGILDDIRSLNDQNTRIIGDFTKMVRTAPIVELMKEIITNDVEWGSHFIGLVSHSDFPELNRIDPVVTKIVSACNWLAGNARKFRRATLQTRFFEVGDNFYLGMEFPREYNQWKTNLVDQLVISLTTKRQLNHRANAIESLKQSLSHSIDRLWYFACLETIRTGDVYNPGARHRVPRLYLINSTTPQKLGTLQVGESFRLVDSPQQKYEVLVVHLFDTIVRNVEGYVSHLHKNTLVLRQNNLTRGPDGNEESKVAISTFQVRHYINHRTMRVSDIEKGYVFTFAGDEQASPHFMRYSGLTGACINAMSFNNFIAKAINGAPFVDRFREFAEETNWSNGEVVQRGTSNNYGEDGFLRPGFSYSDCMNYLRSKVIEHIESEQNLEELLTRDWKIKMAAALVPRGMEMNPDFMSALSQRWRTAVYENFDQCIRNDVQLRETGVVESLLDHSDPTMFSDKSSESLLNNVSVDNNIKSYTQKKYILVAEKLCDVCDDLMDYSAEASLYHERVSSESTNQPKPVDSVVDDFAAEAQTLANSLILGAAVGSGILALNLVDRPAVFVLSILLGSAGGIIAFGTMTNVSRYKIRNEEARITFIDENFLIILMAVFAMLTKEQQGMIHLNVNPYVRILERKSRQFRRDAIYYDYGEPIEFNQAFEIVKKNILDVRTLHNFQKYLIELITNQYHVNSYVQESLVDMYCSVDEVISRLTQFDGTEWVSSTITLDLFNRLVEFEGRLEKSMQRGPVRWGFVKVRTFWHWDIVVVFRYFYDVVWRLLWCVTGSKAVAACSCGITPIEIETSILVYQMKQVEASLRNNHSLRREIQDFETLFWATKESDIASMIFVSACLTFLTSMTFTIGRIFSVGALTNLVFVSVAVSSIGAMLAVFHLVRKSMILSRLWIILQQKEHQVTRLVRTEDAKEQTNDIILRRKKYRNDIRLLRSVTMTQLLLTLARFFTVTAAMAAFTLALVNNIFPDHSYYPRNLPFWIAMAAFITAIGSVLFFFMVEYVIRYQLCTSLGPFICKLFQDEINECYQAMQQTSIRRRGENINKTNIATWEYAARSFLHKYRFDTVFAADRFGQILQCIQSNGYANRPTCDVEEYECQSPIDPPTRRISI